MLVYIRWLELYKETYAQKSNDFNHVHSLGNNIPINKPRVMIGYMAL
jgi:hypothetical protein